MALKYHKRQTSDICMKLPPTSDSFNQHCQRAWRQTFIWRNAFEQFDIIGLYPIEDYGYERTNDGQIVIRWMTIPAKPDHKSLSRCESCTSGCRSCKCAKSHVLCTKFCGCVEGQCQNRSNNQVMIQSKKTVTRKKQSFIGFLSSDSDDDIDDNDVCIKSTIDEYTSFVLF